MVAETASVTFYAGSESITVAEEGGRQSYEDEYDVLASDSENARAMVSLVEEILPLAKASYEEIAAIPADAAGLRRFLSARVADVDDGRDDYVQSLSFDDATGVGTLALCRGPATGIRSRKLRSSLPISRAAPRKSRPGRAGRSHGPCPRASGVHTN